MQRDIQNNFQMFAPMISDGKFSASLLLSTPPRGAKTFMAYCFSISNDTDDAHSQFFGER